MRVRPDPSVVGPAPAYPSPGPWVARLAIYVPVALACGAAGWFIAALPDGDLAPATAAAAIAAAAGLLAFCLRRDMLTSPLTLLGVPLLLGLAAAMAPATRIFGDWTPATIGGAVLIAVAPLAGAGAIMLLRPFPPPRLQRAGPAPPTARPHPHPHPRRLVFVCVLLCVVGTIVSVSSWSSHGGAPLLHDRVDEAGLAADAGGWHVLTLGLVLALVIAAWARVACPTAFTAWQRRVLEATIGVAATVQALGAGRSLVFVSLLSAIVVAARSVSPRTLRRAMLLVPIVLVAATSGVFAVRAAEDHAAAAPAMLYGDGDGDGDARGPRAALESAYVGLVAGLGEPLRTIAELREGNVRTPAAPTSSIWFARDVAASRAVDPHAISAANAGQWRTATYAGPLYLDFGLAVALLYGFALGAGMHLLYLRFAGGGSVAVTWVYASLAGPVAASFALNAPLYFSAPLLGAVALPILAWRLVRPARAAPAAAHHPRAAPPPPPAAP